MIQRGALLLGLSLPVAALAHSDADFSVYGDMNFNLSLARHASPRLNSNQARFGLRGEEKLDQDLAIAWKLETNIDQNLANGRLWSKDSWLGLRSTLGSLKLGRLLSVYDDVSLPWYFGVGGEQNPNALWANCGAGAGSSQGCFDSYLNAALRYDSPALAGLSFSLSQTLPNNSGAARPARYLAAGLQYRQAGHYLAFAHQRNADVRAAGLVDHASTLAGSITRGPFYLGAGYEWLRYATPGGTLQRHYVGLMPRYSSGPHTLWLNLGWAASGGGNAVAGSSVNAVRKSPQSGAGMFTIGYQYAFSKSSSAYAYYNTLRNQAHGVYSYRSTPAAEGESMHALVIGLRHRF